MLFLHNIKSVATYESKILIRSWFFKVFTVLAVVILFGINFGFLLNDNGGIWLIKAIPSSIPYLNLLLLNTGQAVIAIFLASEFLKRDKKLDTSEVFYVRPLSNAEYVFGKIWGNLRVFLILNLIVILMALIFNYIASDVAVDWLAYVYYFLLISIPTLIFIIGLSIFLMLVFKNQALTFILLLGYIGLTLFYIQDKFYYLFDYMAYNLPLLKSSIIGFSNIETILNHRLIYFCLGLAAVFFTIFLFKRLPNSRRSHYPWVILSVLMLACGGFAAYTHVHGNLHASDMRAFYTAINNKYVHTPKITVDKYKIDVQQSRGGLQISAQIDGTAIESADKFTFCLNPGFQIQQIRSAGKELKFDKDNQIIVIDFGKTIEKGDSVNFTIDYEGKIDETICYLDIPAKIIQEQYKYFLFNIDKRYYFQTEDYILATPETYWYPRPGTAFSSTSPDWQQSYFSMFDLNVKPLPGLTAITQGGYEVDSVKNNFHYQPEYPLPSVSLIIGKYKKMSAVADSTEYNLWYIDGHDYFRSALDSIQDTIPAQLRSIRDNFERTYKLSYPFKRLSIVEVPVQFSSYAHTWTQAQETIQPEMVLFPEKGAISWQTDFARRVKNQKEWGKWDGREVSEIDAQIQTFNNFLWLFLQSTGSYSFSSGSRGQEELKKMANPYFLYPQLFNFRYNVYSTQWPIANRVIELYFQDDQNDYGWEREYNGISNKEKANLLMEKYSFKELLSDTEHRDLLNNVVGIQALKLFVRGEMNIGTEAFRDSAFALLKRNTFKNTHFEAMLDTLSLFSKTDLKAQLQEWEYPTLMPCYIITKPVVKQINDRNKEIFQTEVTISNISDHDGFVNILIPYIGSQYTANPDPNKIVEIKAHQTKQVVFYHDDNPRRVNINTIVSGNLPYFLSNNISNLPKEGREALIPEGEHILPDFSLEVPGEIIVDNEDSLLFSLSEPEQIKLVMKLMDQVTDSTFKYSGISWWRSPLQWTATTDAGYYGKVVRSACIIKNGDGNQTATWTVPLPEPGQYDVYYYVYKRWELKWNRNTKGEYQFFVCDGKQQEEVSLDMQRAQDGWEQLGSYYFETDTAKVILTNKSKLRNVAADAVRFIKR